MDVGKRRTLQAAGWQVGPVKQFPGLTGEEGAFVEPELSLAGALRQSRTKHRSSQTESAKRMISSQPEARANQ